MDEKNILPTRTRTRLRFDEADDDEDSVNCMEFLAIDDEPRTYREALNSDDRDQWMHAMQEEYDSLLRNNTWELVDRPIGQKVIDNKWVFKLKKNPDGSIERFKARLVVRGFTQKHGIITTKHLARWYVSLQFVRFWLWHLRTICS